MTKTKRPTLRDQLTEAKEQLQYLREELKRAKSEADEQAANAAEQRQTEIDKALIYQDELNAEILSLRGTLERKEKDENHLLQKYAECEARLTRTETWYNRVELERVAKTKALKELERDYELLLSHSGSVFKFLWRKFFRRPRREIIHIESAEMLEDVA